MSEFHENKRYLFSFANVSWVMIISLLLTVSYQLGYATCMKDAIDAGKAVKTERGYRWIR